jgi:hypothetical protein
MRLLAVMTVWATAGLAALAVAHETKIGPIVWVLSTRHGVHLGDIAAFVVAGTWASMLTLLLFRSSSRRSH